MGESDSANHFRFRGSFNYWRSLPRSFWGPNRMACWLLHSGFASEHAPIFHRNRISYAQFVNLSDSDLIGLEIASPLTRLKLLRTIRQIRHISPSSPKLGRKNAAPMWTKENVLDWLDTLEFGWSAIQRFDDLAIDGSRLVRLNDKSLRKLMGVKSRFTRLRYLLAINSLSKTGNWRHLSYLDYDFESARPDAILGFFSPSFVISASFRGGEKGLHSNKKFAQILFPFNSKQINLSMFTYKDAFSRKRKRNAMEAKDVAAWLESLGYAPQITKAFQKNRVDGAELFELAESDLGERLGIASHRTRSSLLADIEYLKSRMSRLFDLPNLIDLYYPLYRKLVRNVFDLTDTEKNRRLELIEGEAKALLEKRDGKAFLKEEKPHKTGKGMNLLRERRAKPTSQSRLISAKQVLQWAARDEIARHYLGLLEKTPPEHLIDLFANCSAKVLKSLRLAPAEERECLCAVEKFRLDAFRERFERPAPPADHGGIPGIPGAFGRTFSSRAFSFLGQNNGPFARQFKRLSSPQVFRGLPPPPPKDLRPPFDVGVWKPAHVRAFLKNIRPLGPYLSQLANLDGRMLLDMARSSNAIVYIDAKCSAVLKRVARSLASRDLANISVEEWTPGDVQKWVEIDTDFPRYGALFRQNNITGRILVQLTHDMLLGDFGINLAERKRILVSIQKLISKAKPYIPPSTKKSAQKTRNSHNLTPLSLWSPKEVLSWIGSFRFGSLYSDTFHRLCATGTDLLRATNRTLKDVYLVPISKHRDAMMASLENYKSESDFHFEATTPTFAKDIYGQSAESFPFAQKRQRTHCRRRDQNAGAYPLGNGKAGACKDEVMGRSFGAKKESHGAILIECSFCRKRFDDTDSLIAHLAIHEKNCSLCLESFASKETLEKHMAKKHSKNAAESTAETSEWSEQQLLECLFGGKGEFGKAGDIFVQDARESSDADMD